MSGISRDDGMSGIRDISISLGILEGVLLEIAKIEKIPFSKCGKDQKFYAEDDFIEAYEKHRPPEGSEKKTDLLNRYNHFYKKLQMAIKEGRIKPVHKIGKIDYYNTAEMKVLVDTMREANK